MEHGREFRRKFFQQLEYPIGVFLNGHFFLDIPLQIHDQPNHENYNKRSNDDYPISIH
jgi:hypothetical protein